MTAPKTNQELAKAVALAEALKKRDSQAPLEARPVQGEVDFEAMRKDIMARFPKILAKLAEYPLSHLR